MNIIKADILRENNQYNREEVIINILKDIENNILHANKFGSKNLVYQVISWAIIRIENELRNAGYHVKTQNHTGILTISWM